MHLIKQDFHSIKQTTYPIYTPFSGLVTSQNKSDNPLVCNKVLGLGVCIEITNYQLFAPFTGRLVAVNTGGLEYFFKSKAGITLYIIVHLEHALPLSGYKQHVKAGSPITKGDLIASFDFRKYAEPVVASVLIRDTAKLSKVLDKCFYQAQRINAPSDILFNLTKRQINE